MVNYSFISSVAAIAVRQGFAHIIIGFDMDVVPLRFVYHLFFYVAFLCCLPMVNFRHISLCVFFFFPPQVSDSPIVLQKGEILGMGLIEIQVPHLKLSSVSAGPM